MTDFLKKILFLNLDSKRIYGLDILRAFAILFVILWHSSLISYSMYLVNYTIIGHYILKVGFQKFSFIPYFESVKYLCFWILTYIISVLLYKYFEVPFTKLRDKIN